MVNTEILALVWNIACATNPSLGIPLDFSPQLLVAVPRGSLKQLDNQETAYFAASHELTCILAKLAAADEAQWDIKVDDAEEAISRVARGPASRRPGKMRANGLPAA